MSTVCIQIPESTVSIITYGAIAAMASVLVTLLGMVCPFLSNIGLNRRLNMINGLLQVTNDQPINTNNRNLP
jgi:hypothetical protein